MQSTKHPGAEPTIADRRTSPRIDVNLQVDFQTDELDSETHSGLSYNLSAGGLYFRTDAWEVLKADGEIGMRLSGRTRRGRGRTLRSFHAKARVIRVDAPTSASGPQSQGGVALRFDPAPCFQVYRWAV
jgi:c-di-GMP-binding flagellar brake protein YcgR